MFGKCKTVENRNQKGKNSVCCWILDLFLPGEKRHFPSCNNKADQLNME